MRNRTIICIAATLTVWLAWPLAAPAQTPADQTPVTLAPSAPDPAKDAQLPVAQRSHLKPLDPANPYSAKITRAASELAAALNDRQAVALSMIRVNFGNMGAVRIAEGNVERAVRSCDRANPSLQDKMDGALRDWKQTVGPALGDQQKKMAATIHSGIAGDPHKVSAYFSLIDHAASWAARKQDYPPPTAAPACQALLDSMARTKSVMADLLAQQTWPARSTFARARPAAPPDSDGIPAELPHSLPPATPAATSPAGSPSTPAARR